MSVKSTAVWMLVVKLEVDDYGGRRVLGFKDRNVKKRTVKITCQRSVNRKQAAGEWKAILRIKNS